MTEAEYIRAIVTKADCALQLDENNLYVSCCNLAFAALKFFPSPANPIDRVCYAHEAGRDVEPDGLIINTHAAPVSDPVWHLLDVAYAPHRRRAHLPRQVL